jgi:hypothetical protein
MGYMHLDACHLEIGLTAVWDCLVWTPADSFPSTLSRRKRGFKYPWVTPSHRWRASYRSSTRSSPAAANVLLSTTHDRIPVILDETCGRGLDESAGIESVIAQAIAGCPWSKPKVGHIDDAARPGLEPRRYGRSSESDDNLEHPSPMRDGSGPHCNMKRKPSGQHASALRRTR